jgi:hypothetical protein
MRDAVSGAVIDAEAHLRRRIRGGRGFGDALYVRPITEFFVKAGNRVTVMSDYTDVFRDSGVTVEPFNRNRIDVTAHYTTGKHNPRTTQWQDVCRSAGVQTPFSFTWNIRGRALLDRVLGEAKGKPIILVNGGREPMNRIDGFGRSLLPERCVFDNLLSCFGDCFTVRIGKGRAIYPVKCDLDLSDATKVADVLDLAQIAAGVIGQCSFAIPLGEVFDKPVLVLWSYRIEKSPQPFIACMTPRKLLSKPSSAFVRDDAGVKGIEDAAAEFRGRLG